MNTNVKKNVHSELKSKIAEMENKQLNRLSVLKNRHQNIVNYSKFIDLLRQYVVYSKNSHNIFTCNEITLNGKYNGFVQSQGKFNVMCIDEIGNDIYMSVETIVSINLDSITSVNILINEEIETEKVVKVEIKYGDDKTFCKNTLAFFTNK